MSRIAPESRLLSTADLCITDINREFLRLLIHPVLRSPLPVLGLDPAIRARLRRLSDTALDSLAATPILLAEFHPFPGTGQQPPAVLSDQVADQDIDRGWLAERRAFADRLLTCLWQAASKGPFALPLGIGLERDAGLHFGGLSFTQIRRLRGEAADCLRTRLGTHPSCWPDLIRGVTQGDEAKLVAARLSLIPLTVGSRHPGLPRPARLRYT